MIKRMTAADLALIAGIDKAAFGKPWKEQDFKDELEKDYAYYFTADAGGKTVGYGGIWCVYETAELIRIAVEPSARGCGTAGRIMEHILDFAAGKGCEKMMLEVRESNEAARGLYKKYGFSEISVRKDYYDGDENAIIMQKEL